MNKGEKEAAAHEIVIIRRRHDGDGDGHHGGTWKIAFADFMTALMCFFLVMWLINSSDKKTLTQIAAYFNPVKLTDKVTHGKGVRDPEEGATVSPTGPGAGEEGKGQPVPQKEMPDHAPAGEKAADAEKAPGKDEMLFRDPFGVLQKLAVQAKAQAALGDAQNTTPAVFNPFQPDATNALHDASEAGNGLATEKPGMPASDAPADIERQVDPKTRPERQDPPGGKAATNRSGHRSLEDEAAKLQAEIGEALKLIPEEQKPHIDVTVRDDGLLISLTDNLNFAMFAIGSAEPVPQLVAVMDRLAPVIRTNPGRLFIRGHTDSRPFKGPGNGNWHLSIDRAHVAYFMLLRGQVNETRFVGIEGNADRDLKDKKKPEAAENRRIEILLKPDSE